jgi:hypothetical protein
LKEDEERLAYIIKKSIEIVENKKWLYMVKIQF